MEKNVMKLKTAGAIEASEHRSNRKLRWMNAARGGRLEGGGTQTS